MSGLEDRVREAVGAADRNGEGLKGAFVAFLRVLEDSFDLPTPDPAEAAPVRELPTEPGAVILALAVHADSVPRTGWPMRLGQNGLWLHEPTKSAFAPAEIGDWAPARVVRDDEHGPVAALRRIHDEAVGHVDECSDECSLPAMARDVAAEALAAIEGATT